LNLVKEYQRGNESEYLPYIQYLFGRGRTGPTIPSRWSEQGKGLLTAIRGDRLQPDDLTDLSYRQDCASSVESRHTDDDDDDDVMEFSYAAVISRGWNDKLVPVLDIMNHRSGRYSNVDTASSVHDPRYDSIEVYATRKIKKGEQLHLDYMNNPDEYDSRFEYVLPQILRDVGFVDTYPQRWSFPTGVPEDESDEYVKHIVFDIDEVPGKGGTEHTSSYKITWHVPDTGLDDVDLVLNTLGKELKRLEDLRSFVDEHATALKSDYERETSLEYYRSLVVALQQVMAYISDEFGDNDHEGGEDHEDQEWMACRDFARIWEANSGWELVEDFNSFHQEIDIFHHAASDDACLMLGSYLHACASNRPHYHEPFVVRIYILVTNVKCCPVAFTKAQISMFLTIGFLRFLS
jgi:hypothetical protein